MIHPTVRQLLADDEDVRAIVDTRIYDSVLPESIQYPCITMYRVSEVLDTATFMRQSRFQIDAYAYTHAQATALAETIQKALTNRTHSFNDVIVTIQPKGLRDLTDAETRLFRVSGDYSVIYRC